MKTFLLLVVLCGLLSTAEAWRRFRKCKGEKRILKNEVRLAENELQKYMTNIFESRLCGTGNKAVYSDGKYMLNTEGDQDELYELWCIMVDPRRGESDDAYTVSVDLYADRGNTILGIAYNVKNLTSFDFIMFSPLFGDACNTYGHVEDDYTTTADLVGSCPTKLKSKKWFNAKVVVTSGSNYAEHYKDGVKLVTNETMHFPKRAKAGVILLNGYNSRAHFKNLEIE